MSKKKNNPKGKAQPPQKNQCGRVSLWTAVEDYLRRTEKPFTSIDIIDAVGPQIEPRADLAADIRDILKSTYLTFHDNERDLYVLRASYFHKAQFRALPTQLEIEQGILLPGHRLTPFLSPNISPTDAHLSANGQKIKTKKITLPLGEVACFCNLFGWNGTLTYLVHDDRTNADSLKKAGTTEQALAKAPLRLKVFNMADFYKKHGFQKGDSLLITLDDWHQGQFSCKYCPASKVDQNALQSQLSRFETALAKSIAMLGHFVDAREQIAYALFYGGKELLVAPGFNLPNFLAYSQRFALKDVLRNSMLWPKDDEPPVTKLWQQCRESEIAWLNEPIYKMISMHGMVVGGSDMEAFIKDSVHQGVTDPQQIFRRIWPEAVEEMLDQNKQRKKFDKLFADVCARITKQYKAAAYTMVAPYRKRILDLLQANMQWLMSFDVMLLMAENFCQDSLNEMRAVCGELRAIAIVFNGGDSFLANLETAISRYIDLLAKELQLLEEDIAYRLKKTDTVKLSRALKGAAMDAALASAPDAFGDLFESEPKRGKKGKQGKSKAEAKPKPQGDPDTVYQLRIALIEMPTPIWRIIQVTGDVTLAKLHNIIQTTMGWSASHLHSFTIDDVEYGDKSEDDMFGFDQGECLDEADYEIGQLIESQGARFMYEYDFGDSWLHEITVEAVVPREPGKNYPVCLDGKGACPPEDCGGVPGFEHLLKVMKNPKHREYKEMLEWLGESFDPNAFDINAVNKKLQR